MPKDLFLGFDFGYKRIGVAVGQRLTGSASPLTILPAKQGVPNWLQLQNLVKQWQPQALVVGYPTCIDGTEQYTTEAARVFALALEECCSLPVHLVDERLSSVEARAYLFEHGGYRQLKKTGVDSLAACVILEQWLRQEL